MEVCVLRVARTVACVSYAIHHSEDVEIVLTTHAADNMPRLMVTLEQIQRCVTDPDRVGSAHLSGARVAGLRFERDFERGVLVTIVRQQEAMAIVVTVYWIEGDLRGKPSRRGAR